MKKLLLHEDMFFDIPNVDYKLDTELELKGPEPGEDVGVSGLLLDLIGDIAKNINDYNQLQANLENYPEIAELIKDFADDENMKLGKIQTALKTISPNAEYIMNGAAEAEEEMDPGSPLDESLKEDTNFVNQDVINLLNDYFRNHLRADNTWAEIDSVEVVGKDTYKVEVHFKGINTYSTVDSDGYRYTEYEDTDEYKTYVVKVDGNYVSIISNESLKESNESWDSSRALDVARYCWDKGYDEDKAYQVTVAQLKKEGSALPKDLDRVKTVIYDYYDEQSGSGDDFLDESLKNHI